MNKQEKLQERKKERFAIEHVINNLEKSWKPVLEQAEKTKKDIAVARIKGMFDGWREVKNMLNRRDSMLKIKNHLEEEEEYYILKSKESANENV
jgi:hypothetical protein